ncbi:uncharacterized protein BX664DRAFT_293123 [Halteromyces radiatus]|uniref:uncharacterized protein n=1 Tax=Halteromyces radiatus TaxID=101107 RepID=UPI00222127C9|nr:uncharacterized protein BX664DRAFT_293123 [Halteromyces radiatus]KAI8097535.1 hypothetical protein BX664DRAFT_293123 [Halteromyces radiatus]
MTKDYPDSKLNSDQQDNGSSLNEAMSLDQVIDQALMEAQEALADPYRLQHSISRVAVIGAGPAGLATAKSLLEQGFDVHVVERNTRVGGNWAYSAVPHTDFKIPATNDDLNWLKSIEKTPSFVHSTQPVKCTEDVKQWLLNHHQPATACYEDLYNNTATPVLGSFDFPWPKDTPYFVPHHTVQKYYQDYSTHFGLDKVIRFNISLDHMVKKGNEWELSFTETTKLDDGENLSIKRYQDTFDAVVLATGQFQIPSVPAYDGLQEYHTQFPGKIIHSKQFRKTSDFKNKKVLVIGGRVSAVDVSRLVSIEASQVYISYNGPFITNIPILNLVRSMIPDNVVHKPLIESFWSKDPDTGKKILDGKITFTDGSTLDDIDIVIFATGYKVNHPYLGSLRTLTEDDANDSDLPLVVMSNKGVQNTYKDIFLITDPTLAFAGAPRHIITTPFFDYQAKAITRVWSEQAYLPSQVKMKQFARDRKPVCNPLQMDYVSEQLRPQFLLPWLNLHAETLAPDLPRLQGPSESLQSVWKTALEFWPKFVAEQQEKWALERNGA